jgi:hypothetical protein
MSLPPPRVFRFGQGRFDHDLFGPLPPPFPVPPGGLVPLNPDAPWRDGPMTSEVTIMLPGESRPVTVSTSGVNLAWQVEGQSAFSCECATAELRAIFADVDLRGRWLRWEHPTLGVWAGRINDVEADGDTATTEIAALDYSDLLSSRRLVKDYRVTAAPAGALAKRVVRDAAREAGGYSWITEIVAEETGDPISLEVRGGKVDDALRTIADRANETWWVDEHRVMHWSRRRGHDLTGRVQLVEGRHVSALRYSLALGPIVNDLLAVPGDDAYAQAEQFVIDDDASIRRVGRRQDQISYTGMVTAATIRPLAKRDLARLVALGDTVRFDLINVDGCYAWFREGDSVYLLAPSLNRRLQVRVLVRSFDSDQARLTVSADVEAVA